MANMEQDMETKIDSYNQKVDQKVEFVKDLNLKYEGLKEKIHILEEKAAKNSERQFIWVKRPKRVQ